MESLSRLDYVMKLLRISGKDISDTLLVDKTTVSKWRNNQRRLNYKGKYAHRLAELLLSSEMERKQHILTDILKVYNKDFEYQCREHQIDILCFFLTEEKTDTGGIQKEYGGPSSLRNGYYTNVGILLGDNGIDEAIECFMKSLLKTVPGKTIYLIDHSGINWIKGDESTDQQSRINHCMDLFQEVLDYGHKLVIVDCDTDIYRPYKAIFRWMKLYLTEGVEVWTHRQTNGGQNRCTSFAVKNEIALQCIFNTDYPNEHHSMIFKNRDTADFLANSAESILHQSKKLIETIKVNDIPVLVNVLERNLKPNHQVYMINPSLPLQITDEDLLEKILADNGVDREKTDRCLLARRRIQKIRQKCRFVSICDSDGLDQTVMQDHTVDYDLSGICEKTILLSRDHWSEIIRSIIKQENGEAGSITFTSFSYLSIIPTNLSILVQDDSFVAAWDLRKFTNRMYCIHPDVISGFYRYIDDIWNMIPRICKNGTWRNRQLYRLLENG